MNNYSSEDIEKYLLLGYEPKNGRTISKNLFLNGLKLNMLALVFLAMAVFATMDNFNVNVLILVAVVVFLILVSVTLGIRFNRMALRNNVRRNFQQGTDAGTGKVSPLAGSLCVLGPVAGWAFARFFFPRMSDLSVAIIVSLIMWPIFLLFSFFMCYHYHQLYWLYKYCPHLKERRR